MGLREFLVERFRWKGNQVRRAAFILLGLSLVVTACGGDAEEGTAAQPEQASTVTTTTTVVPTTATTVVVPPTLPPEMRAKYPVAMADGLTGPDTQEMVVWAPEGEGPWPVVIFLAGWEGKGIHYAPTAEMLAGQGVVVVAPDYRSKDIATADWRNPYRDAECAYRHVRAVASEYGGDIDQPITIAGHSLGASVAMAIVLFETEFGPEGTFDRCPSQVPRPDRVVALSGCHLKSGVDGREFPFAPIAQGWTHQDAPIHLVVGGDDTVCEPWQSEEAADTLAADGYENVELTVIDDADHFDVIFTGYRGDNEWYEPGGEWFAKPNDPGGVAAVQAILDTITNSS